MKKTATSFIIISASVFVLAACGAGAKDKKGSLNDMKVKLEKLKKDKQSLDAEIRDLEKQITKLDPNATAIKKLVEVDTLRIADFKHYIELQGKIDADGMGYVAPTGMGGQVKAVYVKLGSHVRKGQLILKLDDALARQSVVAARQSAGVLETRLAQAKTVYQKYQNLWKENIGSEIQVINAKADVDALQSQLNAAKAQIAQAQEQVNMSNVYAGMSGVIDEMNVKVGEFFSPQSAATPGSGIRIVNNSQLKIVTDVPDIYVTRVKKGEEVKVEVPDSGKPAFNTTISVIGASIDPTTRSFVTEAKLPSDPSLKPNQTATMKILDYESKGTIAVPINIVQSDENSKFVYVMEKQGEDWVARKKQVTVGEAYNGLMEIKSGLTGGEVIITVGYQNVYDGQVVTTDKATIE
ncbi:MAG: efflux RND transporter periplasmic adaptor subunit [Chitinophagaceae bacterium]